MGLKNWIVKKALFGKLPNFVYRLAGKKLAAAMGLEDAMSEEETKKKWYRSKNVWTGIVTLLIGTYEGVKLQLAPQFGWPLPDIPPFAYTLLGALGIYTRVVADKRIG